MLAAFDVDGDAPCLIAVAGLHDHRQPDLAGRSPGVDDVIDRTSLRYWHTRCVQQLSW